MKDAKQELYDLVYEHYGLNAVRIDGYIDHVISECERIKRKFGARGKFVVRATGVVSKVPRFVLPWLKKHYNPYYVEDDKEWLLGITSKVADRMNGPYVVMNYEPHVFLDSCFDYVTSKLRELKSTQA